MKSEISDLDALVELAIMLRERFLQILQDSLNTINTRGTCAFACYFAKHGLAKANYLQVTYRGGDGCGDGGYIDQTGHYHGHYWLEIATATGPYIMDITADQFGEKPIVVLHLSIAVQYIAGCQRTVDIQFTDLIDGMH